MERQQALFNHRENICPIELFSLYGEAPRLLLVSKRLSYIFNLEFVSDQGLGVCDLPIQ